MAFHCMILAAVLFFVALPLSQQQISLQCIVATRQIPTDIPAFCQWIVRRFNDPQYRVDFTQEEVADICLIDWCFPLLQVQPYCKTFVSYGTSFCIVFVQYSLVCKELVFYAIQLQCTTCRACVLYYMVLSTNVSVRSIIAEFYENAAQYPRVIFPKDLINTIQLWNNYV